LATIGHEAGSGRKWEGQRRSDRLSCLLDRPPAALLSLRRPCITARPRRSVKVERHVRQIIRKYYAALASGLSISNAPTAYVHRGGSPVAEMRDMQDFYWIALVLGLLAATLGYAALCDRA
jgi:hypothetical protein